MKTSLKIALLAVALIVMDGCSAQNRAARRVRRAVVECPELVQLKAHPIEGTVTAPAFADMALVPLAPVLACDTLYAATQHGTVVVSLSDTDSSLRVGFVAAPREMHYQDTVRYAQVVLPPAEPQPKHRPILSAIALWLCGIGLGMALCLWLVRKLLPKNKR